MTLFSLTAAQAQLVNDVNLKVPQMPLIETDALNLNPVNLPQVLENFAREQAAKNKDTFTRKSNFVKAPKREGAQSQQFTVAAQSFQKNNTFVYEGGDFSVWNIGVIIDGTEVTFEHMFQLEALSPEWNPYVDNDIVGVYDPEEKTVKIPTPTGANGTVAAVGNSSTITVISGEVSEDNHINPESHLILDVVTDDDGNIIRMTSRYPILLPTYYGATTYGNNNAFRQFIINLPGDDAYLLPSNTTLNLGECFEEEEVSKTIQLINLGGATASFVVDVESEPEDFIVCNTATGEVEPGAIKDVEFVLKGVELTDDVEGIATIAYEGGDAEGEFDVVLTGQVVSAPDFSEIVTNGVFMFKTNIDCPWDVITDADGVKWAMSGPKGTKATSDLWVYFTVPEGQIGTLTWIGKYKNNPAFRYAYYNPSGWFIDSDQATAIFQNEGDASGEYEFGPGEHFVRFQHQPQYASGYVDDGLYIRNLNLDLLQCDADAAEVKTTEVDFGYFLLDEGATVDGEQTLVIQNRGANPLTLTSISCDSPEFTFLTNVEPAKTYEDLNIPVYFSTKEAGVKTATITVVTSAGTYTVPTKATVINTPDFSQIVTEGAEYMTFTTNPSMPFVVENGVAFNYDWTEEDLVESPRYATGVEFTVSFDIPEGKIGYISWDGTVYGNPEDNVNYTHNNGDQAILIMNHSPLPAYGYGNYGQTMFYAQDAENGGDAGSNVLAQNETWATYLTNVPGSHSFTFRYYHNGDGKKYGKNRLEISNLRLHVEDIVENDAQLMTEGPIEFRPTYVGYDRYTTVNVTLKNTGCQPLSVTGFETEKENSPFLSILPTYTAQFNNTLNVTLVFYPGVHLDENGNVTYVDETVGVEDHLYTDNVTIKTTGGDFTIPVTGFSMGSEGIVLIGDFEDYGYGWERIDYDGDGRLWDLGTNLWYYENPGYCHSGVQCVGSASADAGAYTIYTPDNWLYSPEFTIPEEGAILSWWAASLHNTRCEEHYSVYIEEDFSDVSKLDGMTPVFSETLENSPTFGYHENTVDLKDYAGKTVRLAFRHHDCEGQYLLLIDDAFVYTYDKYNQITVGVDEMIARNHVLGNNQYFNAAGQRVEGPVKGLNIVRQTMKDGSVKSVKFMMR